MGITDPAQEYFKDGIWGWDAAGETWVKLACDPTTGHLYADAQIPATTPAVANVTMTDADTEYSQSLAASTKKFLIKCRASYDIKLSPKVGESGTTYITIPAGMAYWEDLIDATGVTLYFQCATAGQVAEIIAWT